MKSSLSDNNTYPSICQLAVDSDDFFLSFKQNEQYREILEHTSFNQGMSYLDVIKRDNPYLLDNIDKFKENDSLGCPNKYQYDTLGEISPSTLRYIKILSDLKKLFGNLNGLDIVEIGGGYGGQCKIISDIFNFKYYDILDLKSVSNLINKYLSKLDVKNAKAYPIEGYLCKDKYDLIISNYAFSELNRSVQNEYLNKIINKCVHGYMICNMINNFDSFSKEELIGMNKNIRITEEEPKTHQNNFVIYW
jgi:putative sugar O-methyltransferase